MVTISTNYLPAIKPPQQRWPMILRLIIGTFLLISLIALNYNGVFPDFVQYWFWPGIEAVGFYLLLSIIFYYWPFWDRTGILYQAVQVITDMGLAICMTLITGGSESPFSFLFLLAIINGSLLGGTKAALIVATFVSATWGIQLTLQDFGFLTDWFPSMTTGKFLDDSVVDFLPTSGRLIHILINTGSCYLVAFLSGYLSDLLFLSKRDLVTSQDKIYQLAVLNENIIHSIDAGLITTDHNGIILTANRACLEILGYNSSELIGRSWSLFLPQFVSLNKAPLKVNQSKDPKARRVKFLRKCDEMELILEFSMLALSNNNESPKGRLLVLKDLTSWAMMEEAMRRSEHFAALGELAAGLAHELRTPMASMSGAWHMLSQNEYGTDDQERLFSIIGREMERLANLTNDFLAFARPVHANSSTFDIESVLSDQFKIFLHSKPNNVSLITTFSSNHPVYFDQDQFSQIVWNLLTNAVEAGEDQDNLIINIEISLDPKWPDHVMLCFKDNGPGITPENLPKLFEPFFTTKPTGNGLGLPIINRILHTGGGNIIVSSIPYEVTTFTVLLPRG